MISSISILHLFRSPPGKALLLLGLTLGLVAHPASAQRIIASNGAVLTVANGAVVDLRGATLDFGTTGRLDETTGGRVTGGLLTTTRDVASPTALDVAGLGAVLTSGTSLGTTTITRGHTPQTDDGQTGIARFYDIQPATNADLDATLVFRYHEAELNGIAEGNLLLFRSADGGSTWTPAGGSVDPGGNTITLMDIQSFSRWSAFGEAVRTVALAKPAGWSLASLPVPLPPGESLGDQFTSLQGAFGFVQGSGYVPVSEPQTTEGFWLNLGTAETVDLTGDAFYSYSKDLPAGWSLVGALTGGEAVLESADLLAVFRYVPGTGYAPAERLQPGEGAWVNCAVPCALTVQPFAGKHLPGANERDADREVVVDVSGEVVPGAAYMSRVVLGVAGSARRVTPAPPPAPAATTHARLFAADEPDAPLYRELKAEDAPLHWVLEVDPNGTTSEERHATVHWDAAALRAVTDVPWILREGRGEKSRVVIEDMRDRTSWIVRGTATQVFTVAAEAAAKPVAAEPEEAEVPEAFALRSNYPNPFNPATTIGYDVPAVGPVAIRVYNTLGQLVQTLVDGVVEAGRHTVTWHGRDGAGRLVPSGVYFYRMEAAGFVQTRRLVLLK